MKIYGLQKFMFSKNLWSPKALLLVRDAFKKTHLRTLSQLGLTPPPSLATLGHQQLGHLSWASDPLPPIKIWDILTKFCMNNTRLNLLIST